VTNKRVVFRGRAKAIEWAFAKLVAADADHSSNCIVFEVSNRQKAHVVQFDDPELFAASFEAAVRGVSGLSAQSPSLEPPRPDL
jgi:hypothetical protein